MLSNHTLLECTRPKLPAKVANIGKFLEDASMATHLDLVCQYGNYQTTLHISDAFKEADEEQCVEWTIFCISGTQEVARGWGKSGQDAGEKIAKRLSELKNSLLQKST